MTGRQAIEYLWPVFIFLVMDVAYKSKTEKNILYKISRIIGIPDTVMDAALRDLLEKSEKNPELHYVKEWIDSLPKLK